jgi:predicted transcriptional regulator of viral defense system
VSTLTAAQGEDLVRAFDSWRGDVTVLAQSELQAFVREFKVEAKPDWPCTVDNVLSTLQRHGALSAVTLPSEGDYRSFHRHVTPQATTFDVAATLRPKGYFSHATAVFAHGLTEQIPQTIYLNDEQSQKPAPAGGLTQASLDRAFRSRQRVSKFAFVYDRSRIVILNGKQTGSLGVVSMDLGGSEHAVTNLERTMIDIAVRPVYGGGVYEILAAYRAALDRIEINRIVEYLDSLGYLYPYHQAIGFYLKRAGASAAVTKPLRELGLDFDFHLVHGLKKSVLDPSWRVHIPEGL